MVINEILNCLFRYSITFPDYVITYLNNFSNVPNDISQVVSRLRLKEFYLDAHTRAEATSDPKYAWADFFLVKLQ